MASFLSCSASWTWQSSRKSRTAAENRKWLEINWDDFDIFQQFMKKTYTDELDEPVGISIDSLDNS
jgi:hypothetical protein